MASYILIPCGSMHGYAVPGQWITLSLNCPLSLSQRGE
jgi:hypothetical protein